MRGSISCLICMLVLCLPFIGGRAAAGEQNLARIHHDVSVRLDPASHTLEAEDVITFPQGLADLLVVRQGSADAFLPFRLHAGLKVEVLDGSTFVLERPAEETAAGSTGSGEEGAGHGLRTKTYALVLPNATSDAPPPAGLRARLRLTGTIHHPLVSEGQEYARSFARTPGTIGGEGVVLSGASWWLPTFGDALLTFDLIVDLPPGWSAVSQGTRRTTGTTDGRRRDTWTCSHPMDEVYLIAAKFSEYERSAGNVTAQAFLRAPDENLANKYLEVTAQYIEMYRKLIGPYPFEKFALIENFWETGYGMPSFTLLGPKVIRMPFILHSSYPHEILHNWWGNSVYVDWQTGNWCEGLTAYLADHLIREGQGRGTEYRMDTLKNYRNYVNAGKDFPLTEFRSRHSSATQAIGYGKCLMLCHMLRMELGDSVFARGLQQFYRSQKWKRASFSDLRAAFEEVSEQDLKPFFEQWVERKGAPRLGLTAFHYDRDANRFSLTLEQRMAGRSYRLRVPVAFTLRGRPDAHQVVLDVNTDPQSFEIDLPGEAIRFDIDPEFDVFRRLDRREIPPTLSEMFGADEVMLVLPKEGTDPLAAAWREFAGKWKSEKVEVVTEDELQALPPRRAVWVLGTRNKWKNLIEADIAAHGAGPTGDRIDFGPMDVPLAGHSFVYVIRHPGNDELAAGWIGTDTEAALPGLARKLPHYGKYSWLGFDGAAPDNVAKGRWELLDSPLTLSLVGPPMPPRGKLPKRQPLARLAPVFDPGRLMAHVRWLADPAREGRGAGTQGLDDCADYIAAAMQAAGLRPGGDDGTFFQTFTAENGPEGKPVTLRNVVGVLPGAKPEWKGQSVVLGAHYDHLGRGWPDHRAAAAKGEIYNGADDNASGVSVLLELAQLLGKQLKPSRSIVFVAFTGEEWGLKGSAHYVAHTKHLPAKQALAMVNMDTVGRLEGKKLQVLGAGTASEWRHIAMGVGFTTGVESNCVAEDPGGSDQQSFVKAGVPAVQIFTGAHADYHRPTDDIEKVDVDGMVKVAIFVRETIVYLSERPEPLTSNLKGDTGGAKPTRPKGGRRVSLGTMPKFDFPGPGVKVASVIEGSPAQAAGIQKGDVLLAIDGEPLKNLRGYANLLRAHAPGDTIKVSLRRGDEELTLEAKLVAR